MTRRADGLATSTNPSAAKAAGIPMKLDTGGSGRSRGRVG
jgi:hypothetical protein